MNSCVFHIVKKDLRRFWPLLALWCAALVVRVCLAHWSERGYSPDRGESVLMLLLIMLLNAHLVVRVLAEDSPLKEAAFWRTRPITGSQMLAAKALFIAVWTLALPMLVVATAGWAYGFTVRECGAVAAGQFMLHGCIGGLLWVAALFTQRVWTAIIGLFLLMVPLQMFLFMFLAGAVIAGTMGRGRLLVHDAETFMSASLELTRGLVAGGWLLAACALASWWVYRERRRLVAAVTLAAGIVGAAMTMVFLPWDVLGWVPALSRSEAHADAQVTAVVAQTESSGRASINDVSYRQVFATMKLSGLAPGEVFMPYRTEGRVVWPDGLVVSQNREDPTTHDFFDLSEVLKSLGIRQVPRSPYQRGETSVILSQLIETNYGKLKRTSAEWQGKISVMIGSLEVEARMPLKAGARSELGATRIMVTEVNLDSDDLRVKIQTRHPDLPKWKLGALQGGVFTGWLPQSYALINVRRQEAVFANGGGGGGGTNDGFFSFSRSEVNFSNLRRGMAKEYDDAEWTEWLKEAELVKFRFVEKRRVFVEAQVPLTYRQ